MITVNRRHRLEWHEGLTVREVLRVMRYTYTHLVVRSNGEVVEDERYDTYRIPDESDVRVIHLIAGG
ncbi:MAG: sulfur carrier protein ThiS [Chloroflexota bacterium]|nr:sulfur carrier protein ThiS [Chloroflexota bacterium]